MRENHPAEFADAVAFDKQIRKIGVLKNPTLNAYLHESRKPLGEVTFNGADIPGQGDLFQQECEGMCGV